MPVVPIPYLTKQFMNSFLLITTCGIMALGVGTLIYTVLHASDGHEDEGGFHEMAPRRSRSRSQRKRTRAVESAIDIKAGALQ